MNALSVKHQLPCGHVIEQRMVANTKDNWIGWVAETLDDFLAERTLNHDCKLVSEKNPHGYTKI